MNTVNIFWFRRDLRLDDNAGLYHALKGNNPVLPIFIFDKNILDELEEEDRRVEFIYNAICDIQKQLEKKGSSLEVFYDTPENVFKHLLEKYEIEKVYTNHDYEQYAIDRDKRIAAILKEKNAELHTYKDQVIFEKDEVVKDNKEPYTVFTPYSRKWLAALNDFYLKPYPNGKYFKNFYKQSAKEIPSLHSMGFKAVGEKFPSDKPDKDLIKKYDKQRDYPGLDATSRMGIHLRFGTISIRWLVSEAKKLNSTYLNELIWRDFYAMILWHFSHVRTEHAFKKEYDNIQWRNDKNEFEKWCEGKTGFPLVDAGMRQLNTIGFMHNRIRMVTASFLSKHLLIDWRWGEAYFAKKLLDFEFASNNGGWQWAASTGCDAAPYFRIFNPTLQAKRFDKDATYIKKWVPEVGTFEYPQPMVDHEAARKRALEAYSKVVKNK